MMIENIGNVITIGIIRIIMNGTSGKIEPTAIGSKRIIVSITAGQGRIARSSVNIGDGGMSIPNNNPSA